MIFQDRKFICVPDPDASEQNQQDIAKLITDNGGTIISWKDRFDREVAPQLIVVSQTVNFPLYARVSSMMVPTVTEDWVHESIKMGRIVPLRRYSPDPRNFLREIMVCCSGLSKGDTDAIYAGVKAAGGDYMDVPCRFTTHIISTDASTDKCQAALESEYDIKIVSPEWIDDSIKLQRKVDEGPYLLINPTFGAEEDTHHLVGTYEVNHNPRLAVQSSVRTSLGSDLFKNKTFFLCKDNDLSDTLKSTITFLITSNGGTLTDKLSEATVYLGKWREGDEYVEASKSKKVVGNLTWLYWMVLQKKWDSPLKHLLHYPEVKGGLPELANAKIAITNYSGESRQYLISLIRSLGATYTRNLVENLNTHLIAAHPNGDKYNAAKKWGIKIMNHMWLEETYSQWHLQSESNPRYTHLPDRLDLAKLIGSIPLLPNTLRKFYDHSFQDIVRQPLSARAARDHANEALNEGLMKEYAFQKQLRANSLPPLPDEIMQNKNLKRPHAEENDKEPLPNASDSLPTLKPTKSKKRASALVQESADGTQSRPKDTHAVKEAQPTRIVVTGLDDPPTRQACAKAKMTLVETHPANILVAPKIMRTPKFLCCLADVDKCVTPAWLEASLKNGSPVATDAYEINDASLRATLARSAELRRNGKGLFMGLTFRVAGDVKGGSKVVEQIIKAHQGQVSKRGSLLVGNGVQDVQLDDVIASILSMDSSHVLNKS